MRCGIDTARQSGDNGKSAIGQVQKPAAAQSGMPLPKHCARRPSQRWTRWNKAKLPLNVNTRRRIVDVRQKFGITGIIEKQIPRAARRDRIHFLLNRAGGCKHRAFAAAAHDQIGQRLQRSLSHCQSARSVGDS